ncbi:MAG: mannosyltransferase family protein [Actinomycetota bacterium]
MSHLAGDQAPRARRGVVRLRDGLRFCATVFVIARVALAIVAVLAVGTVEPPSSAAADALVPATPGWHNALDGTDRWDAGWYEHLAIDGYTSQEGIAAFFPGYPLTIRALVATTPLSAFDAATFVSNVSFLAALIVLYALTAREYSVDVARRAVVLIACFPVSFFFFAPYSESLFLFLSLLAFWLARERRWGFLALSGFGAALTRGIGVLLAPVLLVDGWRLPPGRDRKAALAAAAAPLLAPLAYGTFWLIRSGDAFAPWRAQESWHRTLVFPAITIGRAVRLAIEGIGDPRGIYWSVDLVLTVALLLPLVWMWRRLRLNSQVYVGLTVLLVLSYPLPARPLLSAPRFFLVCFPLFWAMALALRGKAFTVSVVSFSLGWIALSAAFMNWGFVF